MSSESAKLIETIEKDRSFTKGALYRVYLKPSPMPSSQNIIQDVISHFGEKSVGWNVRKGWFWYEPISQN